MIGRQNGMGRHLPQHLPRNPGAQTQIPSQGKIALPLRNPSAKGSNPMACGCSVRPGRAAGAAATSGGSRMAARSSNKRQPQRQRGQCRRIGQPRQTCRQMLCLGQPDPTKGRAQHPPAGTAQEQGLPQMRLQRLQRDRQRGLADMQHLGGAGDAAMPGNGKGIVKLAQGKG